MTSFGGEAKSQALLAIKQAREGYFEQAEENMKKSWQALEKSHQAQTNLLCREAESENIEVSVFMLHAANHLSSAQVIYLLAEELIHLHKKGKQGYV